MNKSVPSKVQGESVDATSRLNQLIAVIIDDSDVVRLTLTLMLEELGVGSVEHASGGAEGLKMVARHAHEDCIVFCDLAMPGMDGVEVVREMHRRAYGVGIVLISGRDRRVLEVVSDVARQTGLDVIGSLRKPFSQEELRAMLHKWAGPRIEKAVGLDERHLSVEDVRQAIEHQLIQVVYEPQLSLMGEPVVVLEALARIPGAEGLVRPNRFIPVAEQEGLIEELTHQVIEKALSDVARWRRQGWPVSVSVNLSPCLVMHPDMPERIAQATMRAGLEPTAVMIELTEAVSDEPSLVIESLARFRLMDFRLAIDDFGTGQSTLDRLRRMPFTDLKIDRSFVTGASSSPDKRSIIESSIVLAHRLGLKAIAEGVETEADEALVRRCGCDMAQGYYYSRPVPAEEVEALLSRWCLPSRESERSFR